MKSDVNVNVKGVVGVGGGSGGGAGGRVGARGVARGRVSLNDPLIMSCPPSSSHNDPLNDPPGGRYGLNDHKPRYQGRYQGSLCVSAYVCQQKVCVVLRSGVCKPH